jgi:hypothetical protein
VYQHFRLGVGRAFRSSKDAHYPQRRCRLVISTDLLCRGDFGCRFGSTPLHSPLPMTTVRRTPR